jgi:hypothetical protein
MNKTAAALALVARAGCATTPPAPSVMVLPGSGKSFDEFRHDDHDCRGHAFVQSGAESADQAGTSAGVNSALVGAAVGAAAGAAIGGNGHAAAAGAGLGTATGALVGTTAAAQGTYSVQRRYDMAFTQCMFAKGNKVPMTVGYRGQSGPTGSSYRQAAPPPPPPPPGAPPPPPPRQG